LTTAMEVRRPHRWLWRGLIILLVVLIALVLGFTVFVWWAQPGAPSAFYDPPAELPAGDPGTIIRSEAIDGLPAGQAAQRILYKSTDPSGTPIAVSGVVVTPTSAAPAGGWPVIAWAHGTTGVDRRCAPSIDYADAGLVRVPEVPELLAAGTAIVFTDYPGLGTPGPHPYLVGESEGRAVIDSIRAARHLLGDGASDTAAIYGHSQGGHAAVWADQISATYAPELHIAGVAAMAPPTDLGALLTDDDKEVDGIVLTGLAISSWSQYYPDTKVDDVVEPVARPFVRDLGSKCIATTDQGLTDLPDVAALEVTFLSQDPTKAPGWSTQLAQNAPGDVPADVPLLVAQGLTDTLVRPEVTAVWVQARCTAGANIEYQTYPDTGHFQLRTTAAAPVADWMLARVKGEPAAPGCTDTTGPTSGG
jgi:hypothetical protein